MCIVFVKKHGKYEQREGTEMTDKKEEAKICSKHKIPMVHTYQGTTTIPVYDEHGNQTDERDEDVFIDICPECEEEEMEKDQERFFMEQDGRDKIGEKLKPVKNGKMNTITDGIIEKYSSKFSKNSDIPSSVSKAYVQSAISSQLSRVIAQDSRGIVLPNIGLMWIAPSGVGKTPSLENIIYPLETILRDGSIHSFEKIYNRVTGEFLIHSVSKLKGDRRHIIGLIWDEVTTLAKSAASRSTSSLFETLNGLYDGKLSGSGSVSRGDDGASNVYPGIFIMSGTPPFLRYIDEDFWTIGLGTRLDFLPYESLPPADISPDPKAREMISQEFREDLLKLRKIQKVEWRPDMWEKFNEYQKKVMSDVRRVQEDLEASMNQDNFEVISKSKFPLKVLKYAIIHAASRMNFTDSGLLYVDIQDLDNAIRDVEEYHRNMMLVYRFWLSMNQKYDITSLIEKIKKGYGKLVKKGNTYSLEFGKDDKPPMANPDPKGLWVKHSDLLRQSHMKALGHNSFDEVITTLVERDEIVKRECRVYVNGNKKQVLTSAIFYKERINEPTEK